MSAMLTFRNSQGELVDVPAVAATRLKNEFGAILEQALRGGAVAITRHDTPKAVLISYDEFLSLVKARSHNLSDLSAEYNVLLARMQTPKARRGMAAAFNASSAELGRAAVKAARKRR
jgi:antitoxin Phd